MAQSWKIESFRGAGQLHFDMTPDQVAALLGAPDTVKSGTVSVRREYRALDLPIVAYDKTGVSEITFTRFSVVELEGRLVFAEDPLAVLREIAKRDSALLESYGIVVSRALGVTLTGFHDGDEDQKSITAFKPGVWHDGNLGEAEPFSPPGA